MLLSFHIQITGINSPPVWREVSVPDSFSFRKFHRVIQVAFGWMNSHLYEFKPGKSGPSIGIPSPDDRQKVIDSRKMKLSEVFSEAGQELLYIYDFGDYWKHHIKLTAVTEDDTEKASLTDGKGNCPPEDCGGIHGYDELKKIMKNPAHPEYESMRQWLDLREDHSWNPDSWTVSFARRLVRRI